MKDQGCASGKKRASTAFASSSAPKVGFDPKDYADYLDGMNLTDTEQEEVLESLWNIMVTLVELGFTLERQDQILDHFADDAEFAATDLLHALKWVEDENDIANLKRGYADAD